MSTLDKYLDYYINIKKPEYAILVRGEWGCGKTYRVCKKLETSNYLYVSLNGLSNLEEIERAIFSALHPTAADVLEKLKSYGAIFHRSLPQISVPTSSIVRSQLTYENIVVFDDLERCKAVDAALGIISVLVEQIKCKVVVIAHDEKIVDELSERKEKVFGQTITVTPELGDVFDHFCCAIEDENIKAAILSNRGQVISAFDEAKVHSLRILRHTVRDIERCLNCLEKEYLENAPFLNQLVYEFAVYSCSIRVGAIRREHLDQTTEERVAQHLTDGKAKGGDPRGEFDSRHRDISPDFQILGEDIMVEAICDGSFNSDLILARAARSHHLADKEKIACWRTLYSYQDTPDATSSAVLEKLFTQIDRREITDPGDILHSYAFLLFLSTSGVTEKSLAEIESEAIAYITELAAEGQLKPLGPSDYETYLERDSALGQVFLTLEDYKDNFERIRKHIIKVREDLYASDRENRAKKTLKFITEEPWAFYQCVRYSRHRKVNIEAPFLSEMRAECFWEAVKNLDAIDFGHIRRALAYRYRGGFGYDPVSSEKGWIMELCALVDGEASKERSIRTLRLSSIISKEMREISVIPERTD